MRAFIAQGFKYFPVKLGNSMELLCISTVCKASSAFFLLLLLLFSKYLLKPHRVLCGRDNLFKLYNMCGGRLENISRFYASLPAHQWNTCSCNTQGWWGNRLSWHLLRNRWEHVVNTCRFLLNNKKHYKCMARWQSGIKALGQLRPVCITFALAWQIFWYYDQRAQMVSVSSHFDMFGD